MKIKSGPKVEAEITPASLPDIAFLLLIFFIATTIFDVERGMTITLPPAGESKVKVNRKNVMVISSDSNDNIFIDGNAVVVPEIADIIEQGLEQNENLIISIESHPDSEYQTMIDILDEVKRAKATRFSIKMQAG
ncbi:MAG: hypothetical protein GF355_12310 [Candidatus Eisenbacteria bacterium]|nr:hypothetical protein [Candidatus Eisenbacteria bacterium]